MASRPLQPPRSVVPADGLQRIPRVLALVAAAGSAAFVRTPVMHRLLQECMAKLQLQLPDWPVPADVLRQLPRVLVLVAATGAAAFVWHTPAMHQLLRFGTRS